MPDSKQKTQQLQIRISAEQKARLQAVATAANLSVSKYVLDAVFKVNDGIFPSLTARLTQGENHTTVLAELNDYLTALDPTLFQDAVASSPAPYLPPFLANYVAAMVELAAQQKHCPPPPWVRDIEPLSQPYFGTHLLKLRIYLLTHSPPPFRKRNIFIDSSIGRRV